MNQRDVLSRTGVFIANQWLEASSGASIPVIDPSDGLEFARIARGNEHDVDAAVTAARNVYEGAWSRLPPVERGRLLMRLSQSILDHAEELGRLESRDAGKPIRQARADAVAGSRYFEFYSGACDNLHVSRSTLALPCSPYASRTVCVATSCRGTIPCRSPAVAAQRHWLRATRVS